MDPSFKTVNSPIKALFLFAAARHQSSSASLSTTAAGSSCCCRSGRSSQAGVLLKSKLYTLNKKSKKKLTIKVKHTYAEINILHQKERKNVNKEK